MFKSSIAGVEIRQLSSYSDERGWLTELFRKDELDPSLFPSMAYISMTAPGKTRGPHEHRDQTDRFVFLGTSVFELFLWDNRGSSEASPTREKHTCSESSLVSVLIPPGVVHAYSNTGTKDGLVLNAPNRLYKGEGKSQEVDEIRYEQQAGSKFIIPSY